LRPDRERRQKNAFTAHMTALEELHAQLSTRFPNDHIPSRDTFLLTAMRTHLFRYFNGRPGAAAIRARLNTVRTLAEIKEIIANEESND
jgi:tRNA-dihydrouridine synthase